MNALHPWQLLLVTLAGWINRQQHDVIAYIQEENRVFKNKLKGKRIRFTDDERRRLAVKGKVLPSDAIEFLDSTRSGDPGLTPWAIFLRPLRGLLATVLAHGTFR